ncbi:hypothetical protein ACIOHO_12355 [Streptomyces sp. NPDC087849]|uniref:hypothetical protein n=1 Tax=Streptomyces sp. NPDC087849 TaxID=3365808 RepID=UPI0037F33C53
MAARGSPQAGVTRVGRTAAEDVIPALVRALGEFEALRVQSEQVVPHRWGDQRQPKEELDFTGVLSIEVTEASVKTRAGFAADSPECGPIQEDTSHDSAWRGLIPVHEVYSPPKAESGMTVGPPDYVKNYRRPRT